MTPVDPLRVAVRIAAILEEMGIRYVIGGSLASSIHGEPRLSIDLDIMIELTEKAAAELVERLHPDFYVESEAVFEAVREEGTFNVIHLESAMKVDLFVAENDEGVRRQLDRRIAVNAAGTTVYVYAPEDILVRKLRWFRLGGEQSDLQWRDVLGILRITGERLDQNYLDESATRFDVRGSCRIRPPHHRGCRRGDSGRKSSWPPLRGTSGVLSGSGPGVDDIIRRHRFDDGSRRYPRSDAHHRFRRARASRQPEFARHSASRGA